MSILLETTLGDVVIDLDVEGSPELCKNVLKLAKARYYTSSLVYNVQPHRFCQWGDPRGDGSGGACIYALLDSKTKDGDVTRSQRRFLKSSMGRVLTPMECREKGRVVATEMNGIADTVGSQLLITIDEGPDRALDGFLSQAAGGNAANSSSNNELMPPQSFRSVGRVVEDDNHVIDQIAAAYCDANGRPYADIRIIRALVVDDPFDDPPGMNELLQRRGVIVDDNDHVTTSPDYERPPKESVENRIQADQIDPEMGEEDIEKLRQQEEELLQREDKSRAVVLEMLGDLPSADIKAPDNVLFVCKLNPVTEDEDLELIFSRFDEKVKAEIIRDLETGSSLQYAFVEFSTKEQAAEAYFKMNNALVDDRRIKVDFSQSVAKVWDRFNQRQRRGGGGHDKNRHMPRDPFSGDFRGGGRGGDRSDRGGGRGRGGQHHRQGIDNRRVRDTNGSHQHHRQRHYHDDGRSSNHIDAHRGDRHRRQEHDRDERDRHHQRNKSGDRDESHRHHQHENDGDHQGRERRGRSPASDAERDEFGRIVRRKRSPSPRRDRRRMDSESEGDSYSDDDHYRRRSESRHRNSRSRSRDRKDRKKHKKHKRKRGRGDDSRERKHKKHRKHRRKDKKRRSEHVGHSSASSSRS